MKKNLAEIFSNGQRPPITNHQKFDPIFHLLLPTTTNNDNNDNNKGQRWKVRKKIYNFFFLIVDWYMDWTGRCGVAILKMKKITCPLCFEWYHHHQNTDNKWPFKLWEWSFFFRCVCVCEPGSLWFRSVFFYERMKRTHTHHSFIQFDSIHRHDQSSSVLDTCFSWLCGIDFV